QTYYLVFLQKLIEDCSPERAQSVARQLAKDYEKLLLKSEHSINDSYSLAILQIVIKAGVFGEYTRLFKPITYANNYNQLLIHALMEAELYQSAEQWAWAQISSNANPSYNFNYLKLLRELYNKTGNMEGRVKIATEYLPYTFDFDDYLLVISSIESQSDRNAFRKKMFVRARHLGSNSKAAAEFSVKLLAHEKDWSGMIGFITMTDTPLTMAHVLTYFDDMANANPSAYLAAILNKKYEHNWQIDREELKAYIEEIAARLIEFYHPDVLYVAVMKLEPKHNRYATSSLLATRLKELVRTGGNTLFD
ncbi:MAG: hypothetical protein ABI378_15070, partial [Chitinophagaceae bacterium]